MVAIQITKQEAARELLRRRQARRRLIDFACYVHGNYKVDPMHELIASYLDRVVQGEIKRLIISAPPQHGKSLLTSVLLPSFWLGNRPNDPVIIASYAAELAHSKSHEARAIVESDEYRALFGQLSPQQNPIITSRDSRAVDKWGLAFPNRAIVRAVGVGGGLTGFPATLGIIDDPIAGWKEAQSATIRESTWMWYQSVFRTRIAENGAIVMILTRWHKDDPAGRIIQQMSPDEWCVLRLPAIAESQEERDANNKYIGLPMGLNDPLNRNEGEAVSPQRFSINALTTIRKDVGSIVFSALYQGVPRTSEGNRFKRSWFTIVDAVPRKGKRIRYWDKAGTKGNAGNSNDNAKNGAATAGVLLLKAEDGLWYIEHVVQGWYSSLEREKVIKQTAEMDAQKYGGKGVVQIIIEQEPGSGGKESAEYTIKNLAGYAIKADRPSGDKDTRLEPFAAQAEAGNVFLLRGEWNEAYIEEMISIPNGVRRDMGDATSGAFNHLNGKSAGGGRVGVSGLYKSSDKR